MVETKGNEEREKREDGKGSRERIEKKETKDDILKRRRRNITTCLCLLFSFIKALRYSSEDTSSQLDSAVKRCSSKV